MGRRRSTSIANGTLDFGGGPIQGGSSFLLALDAGGHHVFGRTLATPEARVRLAVDAAGDKREMARLLGVSHATIDRLLRSGMPFQPVGEVRRFDVAECRAWLADHGKQAPAPPALRAAGARRRRQALVARDGARRAVMSRDGCDEPAPSSTRGGRRRVEVTSRAPSVSPSR